MPKCVDCSSFDFCKKLPPNHRKATDFCCNLAITDNFKMITETTPINFLEVGYGHHKLLRHLRKTLPNMTYYGIEPRWPQPADNPKSKYHCLKASVGRMPFQDNFFHYVFAKSCIEHWPEKGDSIEKGLKEIHRTMVPNGKLVITTAIFMHGDDLFVYGKMDKIAELFTSTKLWEDFHIENYRKDYAPLGPITNWPSKFSKGIEAATKNPSIYTICITAFAAK